MPTPALAPPLPPPSGQKESERLARWRALPQKLTDPALKDRLEAVLARPEVASLVDGIFAGSSFLAEALLAEPDILVLWQEKGAKAGADSIMAAQKAAALDDRARLMAQLRRTRRRLLLLIALADLGDEWGLDEVTGALADLADLATAQALEHLLLEGRRRGEIALEGDAPLADRSGIFVLGMGKHGARELNYSSDIDLIVLFDPERLAYQGRETPMAFAVRVARSLVYLLEHKTRDGFVFRTDLRLRPHPPGHPMALPIDDAEIYYERHGQNWERAALIKARLVAGDRETGESFLKRIAPFIWRRSLDFAAIRDIHSIKRQINAHRGFGTVGVKGHDLKVGRGGIREIEFFVQTQQLILGGRHLELRGPRTLDKLARLAEGKWIDPEAASELTAAYIFLRNLEHRLQMVADRQTQLMPAREQDFEQFARFAGYDDPDRLEADVRTVLRTVETHYAALFESEPDLGAGGQLVFTGTDDDPDTIETLRTMGFSDPAAISARIRGWHHGHIRATRSTRARELLTELTPAILEALQRQADVDDAFRLFDSFVSSLPAGVQLFSLIRANPRLLILLCDLMGAAPRLASYLSSNVDLFDAMLAPDFFEPLPESDFLEQELKAQGGQARSREDLLDICRRWAHGRQFQAGLHVLLGFSDGADASIMLTAIAENVIRMLLPEAESWLADQHGRIEGGSFIVLGLGKLGSRELTVGSDLDLIFIFDAPDDARSNGDKPLPATTYYARLGQRLVSAISARTAEGRLYEIDTRLRPSGNVGPVACSAANFVRYHTGTAKTWEHQALTRARPVAGTPELATRIATDIDRIVAQPRDPVELARQVREMRERIYKEHGGDSPWRLKHCRGGIVELEFIAQYLQLRHAEAHPGIRACHTGEVFERAEREGVLESEVASRLRRALSLFHALQAVLRLSMSDTFDPAHAPVGLKEALVRAANRQLGLGVPIGRFEAIEDLLVESQGDVRQFFDRLCPPIDTAPPSGPTPSSGKS